MKEYAPLALRIGIGGLFITTGLTKLMGPAGVVGMLSKIGFPAPTFWAWLLIFVELLFGVAVLTGFKLKYATVPLAIVLIVAIIVMAPSQLMSTLKDVALLSGLISLWLSGAGKVSLSRR